MPASIKYLYDKGTKYPTIDDMDTGEFFVLVAGVFADKLILVTSDGPVFVDTGSALSHSISYTGDEPVRRVNVNIEVTAA